MATQTAAPVTAPTSELGKSIMATGTPTSSVGAVTTPDSFAIDTSNTTNASDPLYTYMQNAAAITAPGYQNLASTLGTVATADATQANTLAEQQIANMPIVQQTYANLADELTNTYKLNTKQAGQAGEQNIGSARAGQAAAGIEGTAAGSFQAPVTQAQNTLQDNIQSLADKFGTDSNKLTLELNQSEKDLQDKADQYRMDGQAKVAALYDALAQAKIQYTDETTTLAKGEYSEKLATDRAQIAADASDRAAAASIQASKAYSQNQAGPQAARDASGGFAFTDKDGNAITPGEYAKQTGATIQSILQNSNNPSDKDVLNKLNALTVGSTIVMNGKKTKITSAAQANQIAQQEFPWLGPISL